MSGECDQCGEHTLDCICNEKKCPICKQWIYRADNICMTCLIQESRDLIKKTKEHLRRLNGMDQR